MDVELRQQKELQLLAKRLKQALEVKMPKLVLSMARADYEKANGLGGPCDLRGGRRGSSRSSPTRRPTGVADGPDGGGAAAWPGTRGSDDTLPPAATIFALMGFFVAATWIDVFAGELAAALEFFAALSGIKPEILGLTLLAWGNSVGDYFTNVAMARKGLANMAPTGACVKASRRVPSTATPALTG